MFYGASSFLKDLCDWEVEEIIFKEDIDDDGGDEANTAGFCSGAISCGACDWY